MKKTLKRAGVLAGTAICALTSAQTGSVALKDAIGTTLSTHSTIASAYATIPSTITQGYIIEPGTGYTGANEIYPIVFTAITGASSINTITLRPATGVTGMTIEASLATANSGVFVLDGADHIVIDGRAGGAGPGVLTFNNLATGANANTMVFINSASYNTVRYCNLNNSTTGSAGRNVFLAASASNTLGNSYNTFHDNVFTGGRYQFNSNGTVANSNTENLITHCEFRNSTFTAFWGQTGNAKVRIESNQFYCTTPTGSGLYFGILFDSQKDSAIITGNRFYDIQDLSTGVLRYIHVRSIAASSANFTDIRNNFFSMMTGNAALINIGFIEHEGTAGHARIAHNSFRMGGVQTGAGVSGNVVSACVFAASTSSLSSYEIRSNLMVNERSGGTAGVQHVAFYIENTAPSFTIDNNTYNSASGDLVRIGSTVYTGIAAYQSAVQGGEPGANNATVAYTGTNDLHLLCTDWGNASLMAPLMAAVPTDIDGDIRSSTTFRGADEAIGFNIVSPPGCASANGSVAVSTGAGSFNYTWMPSGGNASLATGLAPGNYTVIVSDGGSCNATRTLNLAQGPPVFTVGIAGLSNASCFGTANGSASVTVGGEPGPFTYSWQPSGGNAASATNLAPGVYSVVTSNSVACMRTTTLSISHPPALTVAISVSGNGTICAGDQEILSASGSGGTGTLSFNWTGGPSDASFTVQPNTTADYTVNIQDANSCTETATFQLVVNPLPTITVNSGSICIGESFTMMPTGAVTYTFSSITPVISPFATNTYTVLGTDANGCVNMAVSSVTVNPLPNISVAGGSICAGDSFTLSPTGGVTYTYSSGSNVVTPMITTTYTVDGIDANNCTNSAASEVTVNPLPAVTVNSGSVCAGSAFTLEPAGAVNYTFSGGSNVVNPVQTTTFLVTGEDANGCTNVATSTVNAVALPVVSLNSFAAPLCINDAPATVSASPTGGTFSGPHMSGAVFSPSVTGTFTVTYNYTDTGTGCENVASAVVMVDECAGLTDAGSETFLLFPNPGSGEYYLSAGEGIIGQLRVTDVSGRQVYQAAVNNNVASVDIQGLAAGVYYFHVTGETGTRSVKVILQ